MKLQKETEILQPEASKTLIKWYPSVAHADTIAFPFFTLGTAVPMMGGFLATSPFWAFQAETLAIGAALFTVSNGFGYLVGKMSHANRSMNASNVKLKDMFRFASRKTERKLVEEYYVNHPHAFRGLVTKEQKTIKFNATHTVKTYVVSGKGQTYIEQEITETQSHMWDNAMDSIESLMTIPTQQSKPLTMLGK
jgi:hypothetical protein